MPLVLAWIMILYNNCAYTRKYLIYIKSLEQERSFVEWCIVLKLKVQQQLYKSSRKVALGAFSSSYGRLQPLSSSSGAVWAQSWSILRKIFRIILRTEKCLLIIMITFLKWFPQILINEAYKNKSFANGMCNTFVFNEKNSLNSHKIAARYAVKLLIVKYWKYWKLGLLV